MKVHEIILKIGFLLVLLPTVVAATNKAPDKKSNLIDELVTLLDSDLVIGQVGEQIAAEIRQSLSLEGIEMDDNFFKIVDKVTIEVVGDVLINSPDIRSRRHSVWANNFDISELQEIVEFYRSPSGQKFLSKMTEMTAANMDGVMAAQSEFVFTLQVRLLEELQEAGYPTKNLFNGGLNSVDAPNRPSAKELVDLTMQACSQEGDTNRPVPIYRGPPKYPYVAMQFAVEGWVELDFTVTENGTTEDIRTTRASAGTLFDDAAVKAVSDYLYCPGKRTENVEIRIRFEFD